MKEKPHQCDLCGKPLADKTSLKHHMMLHEGNKPYQCDQCDKSYVTKRRLKEHEKSVHDSAGQDAEMEDEKISHDSPVPDPEMDQEMTAHPEIKQEED